MLLNNIKSITQTKNSLGFNGDKNILFSLSNIGTDFRDEIVKSNAYINRDDIEEQAFIDKLLRKNTCNNFIISGGSGAGKSTFILKIANMLKEAGIKTFVLGISTNDDDINFKKTVKEANKYLKNMKSEAPVVILIDELYIRKTQFLKLAKLAKGNPNVKIVCTQPTELLSFVKNLNKFFEKDNILFLKEKPDLYVEMLNSALKKAGFEEIPQFIADKIKKLGSYNPSIKWFFSQIHTLLSFDKNRTDDINQLETIPDYIWKDISSNLD